MTSSLSCPKCGGPRDAKALYCPFCGVVFSRYQPEGQAAPEDPPPPPAPVPAAASDFNPYQAPEAPVAGVLFTAQSDDETILAARSARLVAAILDGVIYIGPFFLLFALMAADPEMNEEVGEFLRFGWLVTAFILNLYFLARDGQTMGKKGLKIRIVRVDGGQATLGRIFALRMLVPGLLRAVPLLGGFFILLDALFIFGPERRCIHDYFADTKVVVA
jgi:uncharacterized RDD family membrane protein YckC